MYTCVYMYLYLSIYLFIYLLGSQSSQSSSGTVMDNYWSNVRSQLDRSTAFIASQSIQRTSNSSRIPLHLRGMDHNQQSNSAESNSQGTSTVLITPRSSRQTNRNTSSRPPRPTPRWHGSCPFRLLHSFEPSSQGLRGTWASGFPLMPSSALPSGSHLSRRKTASVSVRGHLRHQEC